MKFAGILASLALLASAVVGQQIVPVTYDEIYDDQQGQILSVTCSNGPTGMDPPYEVFGALPAFPNIGGAAVVTGWGSTECGTCWELSWTSPRGVDYTVNVLAIDRATEGFNIAHEAMNTLTGGQAYFLGRINATATQVDAAACEM